VLFSFSVFLVILVIGVVVVVVGGGVVSLSKKMVSGHMDLSWV